MESVSPLTSVGKTFERARLPEEADENFVMSAEMGLTRFC